MFLLSRLSGHVRVSSKSASVSEGECTLRREDGSRWVIVILHHDMVQLSPSDPIVTTEQRQHGSTVQQSRERSLLAIRHPISPFASPITFKFFKKETSPPTSSHSLIDVLDRTLDRKDRRLNSDLQSTFVLEIIACFPD